MDRDAADAARERHLRLTKPGCRKDRGGPGHGPYWYLYYTNEKTGRYTSRYEGKTLRPELAGSSGSHRALRWCARTPRIKRPGTTGTGTRRSRRCPAPRGGTELGLSVCFGAVWDA